MTDDKLYHTAMQDLARSRPLYSVVRRAYEKAKARHWDKIYWCIDIHDTLYPSTYADDAGEVQPYYFTHKLIQGLLDLPENVIIFWSSLHKEGFDKYYKQLITDQGVKNAEGRVFFNENPFEVGTAYANFDSKFYFSVLLDDKAGFNPAIDGHAIACAITDHRDKNMKG